ncbi:hypothetical protein D3C84_645910 [compost metagenome]
MGRWRDAANGRPATGQRRFAEDVHIDSVVKRRVGITDGPDPENHVLTGFVARNVAVVFGAGHRQLMIPLDDAERGAFERGALEGFVNVPAVASDEVLMLGGRVSLGVAPLEIDVAVFDFR